MSLFEDLRARMRPSDETVAAAQQHLAETGAETVCTPIAFPGKEYGLWAAGQVVVDAAVMCVDRDAAAEAAVELLGGADGTVGWVRHVRGGHWSVHEDPLSPADIVRLAADEAVTHPADRRGPGRN